MGVYLIDQLLKKTRESQGITQAELCDGICSVETLSRIESGKRSPNHANFEALMERMGKHGEKYLPYVRHQNPDAHLLMEKMNSCLIRNQFKQTDVYLNQLEHLLNREEPINCQLLLRYRAIIDYKQKRITVSEMRKLLIEALQCTIPHYTEREFPKGFFMRMEIAILMNIAISYTDEGNLDQSISMLKKIQAYCEERLTDKEEKIRMNTLLLNSLSKAYGRKGDYLKAKAIGIECMNQCIQSNISVNLPSTLYGIAYNKELLNDDESECIVLLLQSYYIAELQHNDYMMDHINKHMLKRYGETADEWEIKSHKVAHHR